MPVRPPPMTFRCTACGWSKTIVPRSDALHIYFKQCPDCGQDGVEMGVAGVMDAARGSMGDWWRVCKRALYGCEPRDATFLK